MCQVIWRVLLLLCSFCFTCEHCSLEQSGLGWVAIDFIFIWYKRIGSEMEVFLEIAFFFLNKFDLYQILNSLWFLLNKFFEVTHAYFMNWYKENALPTWNFLWSLMGCSSKHIVSWIIRGKIYGIEIPFFLLVVDSQWKRVFRRPSSCSNQVLESVSKWILRVISRLFGIRRASDLPKIPNLDITR